MVINIKKGRRDNEESGFQVRQLGHVIFVIGKMDPVAVNGKMMNSISDVLGLRIM